MKTFSLHIRKVRQSSGAFEHVVIYDAELRLIEGATAVDLELLSLCDGVPDPDDEDTKVALESICRGMESVVLPRGFGGHAVVSNLCIHPIDFIPRMFEQYTREELQRVFADAA